MPTTPRKPKATHDLSTLEARFQAFRANADPKQFSSSYGTYVALRNDVTHAAQAHDTKHAQYVQQLDHVLVLLLGSREGPGVVLRGQAVVRDQGWCSSSPPQRRGARSPNKDQG